MCWTLIMCLLDIYLEQQITKVVINWLKRDVRDMKIAMGWKGRRWFHKLSGIYRRSFRFLKKWMLCGNGENKTWQRGQTKDIKSKKSWSKCWRDGAWRSWTSPLFTFYLQLSSLTTLDNKRLKFCSVVHFLFEFKICLHT